MTQKNAVLMFRLLIFIFCIHRAQVGSGVISDLLNQEFRMGWTVSRNSAVSRWTNF